MSAISRAGAAMIAGHEAVYLYSYRDPVGVLTDGIGNTAAAGTVAPRPGGKITLVQALATFERNLGKYGARVARAVRVPLKQHQFDSLGSFDFNTGKISGGTVDDKLNAGNVDAAMATMLQYTRAGGKVLRGLETRRREEVALFRTGHYPTRPILVKESPSSAGRLVSPASLPWGVAAKPLVLDLPATTPVPPMPTPAPERGSGNVLIDLVKYFWSLWK